MINEIVFKHFKELAEIKENLLYEIVDHFQINMEEAKERIHVNVDDANEKEIYTVDNKPVLIIEKEVNFPTFQRPDTAGKSAVRFKRLY